MSEPVVPPSAEKITINPDIIPCCLTGNELRISAVSYTHLVGVTPTVAEGFSGEDGRTTMFDYWGVPEYLSLIHI